MSLFINDTKKDGNTWHIFLCFTIRIEFAMVDKVLDEL